MIHEKQKQINYNKMSTKKINNCEIWLRDSRLYGYQLYEHLCTCLEREHQKQNQTRDAVLMFIYAEM